MKKLKVINAIMVGICLSLSLQAMAQSNIYELEAESQKILYRVTLPDDYDNTKAYPVLFAPGLEKRTDGHSIYLGNSPSKHNWIIVESIMHMKSDFLTKKLLDHIKRTYRVEHMYLSGFSANSINIFRLGAKYVDLVDGIIGMPGYANDIDRRVITQNPDLQIILIVGEKDTSWKSKAIRAHQKLQAIHAKVSLDIIPNEGHIMNNFAGIPFITLINKRIGIR